MANHDYVTELMVLELLARMKRDYPKDYDTVLEIEKKLYPHLPRS